MSIFRDMWVRLGSPSSPVTSSFMPDVWSPKRTPVRQNASLSSLYVLDYRSRLAELGPATGTPALTLGAHRLTFQGGQWVLEPRGRSQEWSRGVRVEERLRRRNRALQEENNALRLRVELLMDMLTEAAAQPPSPAPPHCPPPQLPSPAPPQPLPRTPPRHARRLSYQEWPTKRKTERW